MYKVYINNTPLLLTDDISLLENNDKNIITARYSGKGKSLFNYIDPLERGSNFKKIILWYNDVEKLWEEFQSKYKIIEAAGGVVFQESTNALLMMYRRGSWDLPKGKIDEGETKEIAAVREVIEETGLKNVERKELLYTSFHTYMSPKEKRILKPTYWYKMITPDMVFEPQYEEDIEKMEWIIDPRSFINNPMNVVYSNINDVVRIACD